MHRQQKLYQETVGYIGGADGVASLPWLPCVAPCVQCCSDFQQWAVQRIWNLKTGIINYEVFI